MSYFAQCLGASYTPVRYGQHEGAHPQRVREAMAALQGRPEADVIAALVRRCEAERQRCERLQAERATGGLSAATIVAPSSVPAAAPGLEPKPATTQTQMSHPASADRILNALENCRLMAARHRDQGWARHILRFCAEVGVGGSPLRKAAAAARPGEIMAIQPGVLAPVKPRLERAREER